MNHAEIEPITNVHRLAFGDAEGPEIAKLAESFLALPDTISISAKRAGKIVGNVLFTPFVFQDHPDAKCYLLAPLGVLPEYQGYGVGKEVMETSIEHLKSIGTDAVFVLGVPTFYPRFGFVATEKQTPFPDLLTMPEPWMELALKAKSAIPLSGKTIAVEPFMQPHFWDTSGRG
ncbi:GNAT family N-acetyltransferase [Ruegeria hyattellae]|uniref:GNAT family N-acetyltransferase n=1 Tax=Ruegeria hyattellae TaxID=3233337 RepID=UPI00355C7E61